MPDAAAASQLLTVRDFLRYALSEFRAAMDSNKAEAQITKDSNVGSQIGANGTPTFFSYGRQLVGAEPIDAFKAIIDDDLKKKKGKN